MKIICYLFAITILAACSNKPEEFIGVHNFEVMDSYFVQDTTEFISSFYGRSPLSIRVNKMVPMKIDLFKVGDEIKGTLTIIKYQEEFAFEVINKYSEKKLNFENIHLINDTLSAEIHSPKKTLEFKLAKSGNDYYLIVQSNEGESRKEICNKFATILENNIIYKATTYTPGELDLIKQSNECAADNTIALCLEKGYKKGKTNYLKGILMAEPKK